MRTRLRESRAAAMVAALMAALVAQRAGTAAGVVVEAVVDVGKVVGVPVEGAVVFIFVDAALWWCVYLA